MIHRPSENGSALIYIFIGVALFGALMFMFSRGSSQNSGNLSNQQAAISSSELIDYGRALESGANRVIANGCSESDITFSSAATTCDIFSKEGGKVSSQANWTFTNGNYIVNVPSVGNTTVDLVALRHGTDITQTICEQINKQLSVTAADTAPQSDDVFTTYTSTYSPGATNEIGGDWAVLQGKSSGCFLCNVGGGSYCYYKLLIAR